MKVNFYLTAKFNFIFILLGFLVASCSDEPDNTIATKLVDEGLVKKNTLLDQQKKITEHWLLDNQGKKSTSDLVINRKLDDQETYLLEEGRKEMEAGLDILIQEMDSNLGNPEVREEISEKMQQSTVEYKQKILLLAKDKLKKQK